jgi:hypothetical protein
MRKIERIAAAKARLNFAPRRHFTKANSLLARVTMPHPRLSAAH